MCRSKALNPTISFSALQLNIFQGLKLVDGLLLREAHVHAFLEKVSINYLDNPYHNFQRE